MLIGKYIVTKIVTNVAAVLVALIMLMVVFNAVAEVSYLNRGNFNLGSLIIYILLKMPSDAYLLSPLAVLIGTMIALLNLSHHSEWLVILTSGVSINRIMYILFLIGCIISCLVFILGEYIVPNINQAAELYKFSKSKQAITTNLRSGIWGIDNKTTFVNIKQVTPNNIIYDVNIFVYNSTLDNIIYKIHAAYGTFYQNQWILNDVNLQRYFAQNIINKHYSQYVWHTSINPGFFNALVVQPENMSITKLLKYMQHLKKNNQSTNRYQIAIWNKILYPIACIAMMLIALTFVPNNRRNINLGSKLFIGILVGIGFFFTIRILSFMAMLFVWNAAVTIIPIIILFACGCTKLWYSKVAKLCRIGCHK